MATQTRRSFQPPVRTGLDYEHLGDSLAEPTPISFYHRLSTLQQLRSM